MDAGIAALIGALIGAIAGVAGTLIAHQLTLRSERSKWHRDKREEAYSNTLRYLAKGTNRLKGAAKDTLSFVGKDDLKGLSNDIEEAQIWLTSLTIYCSAERQNAVLGASKEFNRRVAQFHDAVLTKLNLFDHPPIAEHEPGDLIPFHELQGVYDAVLNAARRLGKRHSVVPHVCTFPRCLIPIIQSI